jgi:hypothetical protein
MNLRRILLRVMLISLALAALVGAASVLVLPAGDVWRIFGTGILTAGACAILLPVSLLTDKPKWRAAGLAAMAAVLIEYLLSLLLIWHPVSTDWEQLGLTLLFFTFVSIPAVALVQIAGTITGRWAGRIGVALAGAEFAVLMIAVWKDAPWGNNENWFYTAGVSAIFIPLIIMSLAGVGAAPGNLWRLPAIFASYFCLIVALVGVWRKVEDHPGVYALLVSIPTVLAYLNVAMLCPLKPGLAWARWVAILSVAATALCIDCGVFLNAGGDDQLFGRLSAATGIIAGCATLALAIFAALSRKIERPAVTLQDIGAMDIICPMCKRKQTLATGGALCAGCGLRIVIRLEQVQCAKCGHLLYGLKFDRCPECGTAVSEQNSNDETRNSNECSNAPMIK